MRPVGSADKEVGAMETEPQGQPQPNLERSDTIGPMVCFNPGTSLTAGGREEGAYGESTSTSHAVVSTGAAELTGRRAGAVERR